MKLQNRRSEDEGMLTVAANSGTFELRFDDRTEGMRFEPSHTGLVQLAATLELMGAMGAGRVFMLPSLARPEVTGLPPEYDAKGFVEVAYTLSQLGLGSSPGGDA